MPISLIIEVNSLIDLDYNLNKRAILKIALFLLFNIPYSVILDLNRVSNSNYRSIKPHPQPFPFVKEEGRKCDICHYFKSNILRISSCLPVFSL